LNLNLFETNSPMRRSSRIAAERAGECSGFAGEFLA
jgi:hypothetical protein